MKEEQKSTDLLCCDLYQFPKIGNGFDTEISRGKIKRKHALIERRYFEEFNKSTHHSGQMYVEDEERTIELSIEREERLKKRIEKDNMAKKTQAEVLTESLEKIINKAGKKGARDDK